MKPTQTRIISLDVIRGFAVLGILLVNILGFGAHSASIFNPVLHMSSISDFWIWVIVNMGFEGAMRGIFSILFGVGFILFLNKKADQKINYFKRTTWLIIFGLFNGYVLMWPGDILSTYGLAGFILYFFRNLGLQALILITFTVIICLCLYLSLINYSLMTPNNVNWIEFNKMINPSKFAVEQELATRSGSFFEIFFWSRNQYNILLTEAVPFLLIWDALAFMLVGMTFYKSGILNGKGTNSFYLYSSIICFAIGLTINGIEIYTLIYSNYNVMENFAYFQSTYQLGRLALAIGWIGLILFGINRFNFLNALAPVGRMALTNYLLQSFVCLVIFSGIGFGLIGQLTRSQLYLVVAAIWVFQICLSIWWLKYFRWGPFEWLWRYLTYGKFP